MSQSIPVFYEGNDDYIEMLAVSIASVCYNSKASLDFYILDCGICDANKKILASLEKSFQNCSLLYIPINMKQFKGLTGYRNNFLDCYARLLIPELQKNLDKAIYLDFDVMLFDDIEKLWKQNFEGFELCACADLGYSKDIENRCLKIGCSKNQTYCNAGVLLIDCQKWREHKVSERLLKLANDIKNDILYICEDLLNIYYKNNNYKVLDLRFNSRQMSNVIGHFCCPDITDEYVAEEWKKVIILHWTVKPWNSNKIGNEDLKYTNLFWFYASLTPFFEGLSKKFFCNFVLQESNKKQILLQNNINDVISELQQHQNVVTQKSKAQYIRLFNFIPILTIKQKNNIKKYILFGFIPLFKLKGF